MRESEKLNIDIEKIKSGKMSEDDLEQKFLKRVMSTKHSVWFSSLPKYKKDRLYLYWIVALHSEGVDSKQTLSFRKYLYTMRNRKSYGVPLSKMRGNLLKEILK